MVNPIGSGGGLASSAIAAALERRNEGMQQLQERISSMQVLQTQDSKPPSFIEALKQGIQKVDESVAAVDQLPGRVIRGEVDLAEAASQIQMSRITFEFTMELRNKFIDAYREIMRMSV